MATLASRLFSSPMTIPITFKTVLDAVAAGEHSPAASALRARTNLPWTDLTRIVDPTTPPARYDGSPWSNKDRALMLHLIATGCSQALVARLLKRPRSGVSYAIRAAAGQPRTYPSTGRPVGRPPTAASKPMPRQRSERATPALDEHKQWIAAFRAAKQARNTARGRV